MIIENLSLAQHTKEQQIANLLKAHKVGFDQIIYKEDRFFDIYKIKLSIGTKISKLDNLMPEIGLQLNGVSIPTGKMVPKEGLYQIEVQKQDIQSKSLNQLFDSVSNMTMPLCLGTDKVGNDHIIDLNKIPNLLIGGTTGSGKSVLLHNIVLSLIKFDTEIFLADPKYVEFTMYQDLPQVKSISNEIDDLYIALDYIKSQMQKRYRLLSKNRSRNISEYNKKNAFSKLKPIALVIDEWADFVLQDKGLQKEICYIAQKGRAAGIGIVLATQRPSVNIISGVIKANFPGRICLKVASQIDSKVILDRSGGEKISGVGTGLYIDGSNQSLKMFRTPYVEDIDKFILENL